MGQQPAESALGRIADCWEALSPLTGTDLCRTCECLHGGLVELRLTLEQLPASADQAALLNRIRSVRRPAELRACLRCDPCGPGGALVDFLRGQAGPAATPTGADTPQPRKRCGDEDCCG
jgi:hypothetical protein